MFKYVLVPATGAETDIPVFRAAVAMARLNEAHLVFLHVRIDTERVSLPMASADYGGGNELGEFIEVLEQEATARHDRAKDRVHSFCASENIAMSSTAVDGALTAEWCAETGEERDWLVTYGRAADLLVLGRRGEDKGLAMDVLDATLMETGRPLLIVPAHPPAQIGQTIAIAWKETAEAAGAVGAALPLLPHAKRVVILSVTEGTNTDAAACERLRAALVWHNPNVSVQLLAPGGGEPTNILLKAVTDLEADLLVMGGYGHTRMRELVFGGFTRRILQAADLPVLMAH